jgi:cytidylate kinase
MIIAIDGHSACGKSTLAKDIARKLNYIYIDSGAMYRAVTFYFLENKIPIIYNEEFEKHLDLIQIRFVPGLQPGVFLNDSDVTNSIRSPHVSEWVSEIATFPSVRKKMVQLQRGISTDRSVVMDGRDIGSVVFPNAEVKIFLTADLDIRAKRRQNELKSNGIMVDLDTIKKNLQKRDHIDSTRTDSPLIKCPDAYILDNTNLNREEQLDIVLNIIKSKSPDDI